MDIPQMIAGEIPWGGAFSKVRTQPIHQNSQKIHWGAVLSDSSDYRLPGWMSPCAYPEDLRIETQTRVLAKNTAIGVAATAFLFRVNRNCPLRHPPSAEDGSG